LDGAPWIFAHEILSGLAYFGVWLVLWHIWISRVKSDASVATCA
jgi:hypothetical protein